MKGFSWQTHEYAYKPKTRDWFWTVGIITAAIMFTSAILGNFLFAFVLLIAVFALTLLSIRKPNIVTVELSEKGVRVDNILYPFPTLESFGIDNEHRDGPRLFLKSKKVVVPLISIPIQDHSLEDVEAFLGGYIKQEHFDQGFLHTLLEHLGF